VKTACGIREISIVIGGRRKQDRNNTRRQESLEDEVHTDEVAELKNDVRKIIGELQEKVNSSAGDVEDIVKDFEDVIASLENVYENLEDASRNMDEAMDLLK
jgi:methyl-accepting chemotaxis protein